MWGVLIFIKFGDVVAGSGLAVALGTLVFCAFVQVMNCLAVSAVATNGLHTIARVEAHGGR